MIAMIVATIQMGMMQNGITSQRWMHSLRGGDSIRPSSPVGCRHVPRGVPEDRIEGGRQATSHLKRLSGC